MSDFLWPHGLQHTSLPCPSLSPRACSNSCSLSQGCYLTISSSAVLFSFCPQSFPASGSFPMGWLFASGGQSIGASASASVLPINIQGWFPLRLIGLISLLSEGLSRIFFSTTIWEHQFFDAQLSFCLINLFLNWRIIALQNFVSFCQTSTWISHSYTYVPSLLNLPPIFRPIPLL